MKIKLFWRIKKMKKLGNKILFLCLFITFHTSLFAGPLAEDLRVNVYDLDDLDGTTPRDSMEFANIQEEATIDNPWVHSSQYIRVEYSSDEAVWGIRIVTDNERDIGQVYPKPQNKGVLPDDPSDPDSDPEPDPFWEWEIHPEWGGRYRYEGGQWLTGNDSVSFGGLINPTTKNNPDARADLAWQVFADPVPAPDPIYRDWRGVWNVSGDWNADWAYVVDKSNRWYGARSIPLPDENGVFYYPDLEAVRYELAAYGSPIPFLAQHPVVGGSRDWPDPKPVDERDEPVGDNDFAIYIAACFGISRDGNFVRILPAGNYRTRIYLELIHDVEP